RGGAASAASRRNSASAILCCAVAISLRLLATMRSRIVSMRHGLGRSGFARRNPAAGGVRPAASFYHTCKRGTRIVDSWDEFKIVSSAYAAVAVAAAVAIVALSGRRRRLLPLERLRPGLRTGPAVILQF